MDKKAQDFYIQHKAKLIEETGGTFYSCSPEDFERLLSEPSVQALLHQWFNVTVVTNHAGVTTVEVSGESMDVSSIYVEIQKNPEMSYKLYQTAMSIWR